jgi:hypothetical protein
MTLFKSLVKKNSLLKNVKKQSSKREYNITKNIFSLFVDLMNFINIFR